MQSYLLLYKNNGPHEVEKKLCGQCEKKRTVFYRNHVAAANHKARLVTASMIRFGERNKEYYHGWGQRRECVNTLTLQYMFPVKLPKSLRASCEHLVKEDHPKEPVEDATTVIVI